MKSTLKLKIESFLLSSIGVFVIIVTWYFAFRYQKNNIYLIPNPISTGEKIVFFFTSGELWIDIWETLCRTLGGFGLAGFFGIISGLLLGSFSLLRRIFDSTIDFFRSIPVTALYPVFVLIFGIGSASKISMIFWASFFIICVNTTYGVIHTNPIRRKMALLYGATWIQVFFKITLYDSLPQTMVGLRIAVSYSLIACILTEMFMGSQHGIGEKITESYNLYQIDSMFALILITGCLGYCLNFIFLKVEKKIIAWKFYED